MKSKPKPGPIAWTPEDRERHRKIRAHFESKPTLDALVTSGEYNRPVLGGMYFGLRQLLGLLKKAREEAGLSLAEVAQRCGIGKAALSRLENGQRINPTANTLYRYAAALGKTIIWTLQDAPREPPGSNEPLPRTRSRSRKKAP